LQRSWGPVTLTSCVLIPSPLFLPTCPSPPTPLPRPPPQDYNPKGKILPLSPFLWLTIFLYTPSILFSTSSPMRAPYFQSPPPLLSTLQKAGTSGSLFLSSPPPLLISPPSRLLPLRHFPCPFQNPCIPSSHQISDSGFR